MVKKSILISPSDNENRERFLTMDLVHRRKLKLAHSIKWIHHHGGWTDVTAFLERELSCDDGILTINSVEEVMMSGRVIDVPWVGFSHEVPNHDYLFPDLTRLQELDTWKASKNYCRGIWVLSSHNKKFWDTLRLSFPISVVYYPVASPDYYFSFESFIREDARPLLFIGEYLRQPQAFFDLNAPGYRKILLQPTAIREHQNIQDELSTVTILNHVNDAEYDHLLAKGVVFLNLSDAGANTTIVECIVRGTPILVNKIGGVSEYLGDDYPLYYNSLKEAEEKLANFQLIEKAMHYLLSSPIQTQISFDGFKRNLENSVVYRSLPTPLSQRCRFQRVDLTVMICTYMRISLLAGLLERISKQTFSGSYEVILWNNNIEAREEVQTTAERFSLTLTIRVIHSSENLYCGIRLAAPILMRSDALLICDDDVLPESNYLQLFWDKYLEYGKDAVICARGHTFLPHYLNMEHPEQVWRENKFVTFHHESEPDQQIHFFHADNALISRELLIKVAQFDMENPDFVLVDDYWMSYIINNLLGKNIMKIKSNHVLQYHPLADDARIAMFENSLVREQRVNFYIYHMQRAWPFPNEK